MTIAPPLPRPAVPAPRPAPEPSAAGQTETPTPGRVRLRDRLRQHSARRREDRAWARALDRAPTPSARAELRTLREYGRG